MLTPERIEEIKQTADDSWFAADNSRGAEAHLRGEVFALCEGTNELLAALEESQQEGERLNEICKQLAGEEMLFQDGKYETEMQRVQGKLAEAQQTIARQQKVIDWYESGGSMGELVEEGVQS
ncbi:hypothetical protein NST58_12920 [Paenibacillus sp. FSL R10-2796]|uniref:hypothetical protein n=1 Tax=Paenibacillus sp. FSL R10-2796 TaxID=2954663 RepID=UPI0030D91CE2